MNVADNRRRPDRQGDGSDQGLEEMNLGTVMPPVGKNTLDRRSDWFPRVLRGYRGGIIHGNRSGATVGLIMYGHLCCESQTTTDEEPTQQGHDGVFPVLRIISCPPMADAVVAVIIFQHHFPSMLAM